MSKKGVYPYDYMDSFEKFDQTELPAKEHFYSILNDQHITNDEYDHAKKFGRLLKLRQWVNTMTYTLEVMCSCWLMYLKNFIGLISVALVGLMITLAQTQ